MNFRAKSFIPTALIIALVSAPALTAEDSFPKVLTTRLSQIDQTFPTWVAASEAVKPDGSIDAGLFHPALWDLLQRLLAVPPDPERSCIPVGESFQSWVNPPDTTTLEKAFGSSERVLRGKVTGHQFGFDRALPGQLFRVEVLENFKGREDLSTYYFFIPVARFKVGNYEICKTDYRFPNIPENGDEVILLVPDVEAGDALLDLPFENGIIVVRGETALLPGPAMGKILKERSRADLLADLARLAVGRRP